MFFQEGERAAPTPPRPRKHASAPPPQPKIIPAPALYPGMQCYPQEFVETLDKAIQNVIREHTSGALLMVSISNLAMIINAYGHDTSEIVMHDLASMIGAMLR